MHRPAQTTLLVSLALALVFAGRSGRNPTAGPGSRPDAAPRLTFEQRVEAQAAIERVYYMHRLGGHRPFDEAVPRLLLELKVRTYLSQSVALETLWRTPIGAAALGRELERIAARTRLPERLREIYDALGNDPYLIQETFVRAALADRLARGFLAGATPAGSPQDWEAWWEEARRDFDPALAREVAGDLLGLPVPGQREEGPGGPPRLDAATEATAGTALPCELQDVWGAGDAEVPPAPRSGHTAVWTGSEMIVWGGSYLNTGGRYDPLTDTWRPTPQSAAPAPRTGQTAVWTGADMIVWGGLGPTLLNTGGRYDPAADSWAATSLTGAPSNRYDHTAVWTGREMIVWGGGTNTGGRYDPANDVWSATSVVNAPGLGSGHVAVWTGREMIVWGGGATSVGGVYDPVGDTWRPTSLLDAPSARESPAAVWTGTEMVVWGGWGGGYAPGGGRYNPATDTWRATNSATAPLNRYAHTAVWTGSRMVIWGGIDFSGPAPHDRVDTGALYDPVADTWTPMSLSGVPSARGRHTAVWSGDLMIVWGGTGDTTGGRYDPSTDSWTPTSTASSFSPSPRVAHTAVWTGSEMIVWGGTTDSSGGRYDPLLDAWAPTSLTDAPSPRSHHAAVWTGEQMIVWGGEIGDEAGTKTGGRYDPVSDAWSPTSMAGAPSARAYHTAVWTGREMIVWGGAEGDYLALATSTGGRYEPAGDAWAPTTPVGAPSARAYHTAIWTGRRMIVWGGWGDTGALDSGGGYDPLLDTWSPTSPVSAPPARAAHTAVWTGREMIVWGGYGDSGALDTGARYDPLADAWSPTPADGAPFGRSQHTAVWTGREMIVWGGAHDFVGYIYSTNTGGRYDPAAGTWAPTTTTDAPESRNLHTAVWIGSAMIVRGGEDNAGDIVGHARDPYVSWYGAAAAVPSPDLDQDGFSVCGGDCDDAVATVYPGAAQLCGDGRNNDCADPAWPTLSGTNEADDDADGMSECAGDCDDANGGAWETPAEVTGLEVQGSDPALLTWTPAATGGALRYDTLRSALPADFLGGAVCVESDDPSDTSAFDVELPAVGGVFFYLVRAENSCPGDVGSGPLGFTSSGAPRQGRACP